MTRLKRLRGLYDGFPDVASVSVGEDAIHIVLDVSPELSWFAGHFPGQPVLPGIVQTHWAVLVSRTLFGFDEAPPDIKRLKFKNIIVPPRTVTLTLARHGENEVQFRFASSDEDNSEGRIVFSGPGS